MHNSIKIDFEGIALEDGGTLVKDVPYVVGLKNYHFILSDLSLGGVIQNDISVEAVVTLESVIENEGQEDEFTSYHQQIVFKNVYGYDVTIYDKAVTASPVMTPQDVIDEIENGTLDNAKPLYFHPITLTLANNFAFSITIIDNNPEPYDTGAKLKAKIDEIKEIAGAVCRFPATGSLNKEGTIYPMYNLEVPTASTYRLYYFNGTTTVFIPIDLTLENLNVFDGVNKIN